MRVVTLLASGTELVHALGPGDTLTSPLLPGFALPLDRLFAGIPFGVSEDKE